MENKPKKCETPITDIISPKDIDKALKAVEDKNHFFYKGFFSDAGLNKLSRDLIKRVFDNVDRNCDGLIDEDDVSQILKRFKPNARQLTAAETADMMKAGDPDNKGTIGLEGFIAMVESSK